MDGSKTVHNAETPPITRLPIPRALISTKQDRRRLSNWLAKNCGRPCPKRGFWWTEQVSDHGLPPEIGMVICFALPDHAVLFNLTWL